MDTKTAAKLREAIEHVKSGKTLGPKAEAWVREVAAQEGMDVDTLLSGGSPLRSGLLEGASFGFRDEIAGGLAALAPGGDNYTEARDRVREQAAANKFIAPGRYTAGEVAGGVATGLVPIVGWGGRAAQAGKAAGKLATAGKMAATGAAEGATYAYGQQEGSNSPFTVEVGLGAGGGAAGGLIGGALLGGVAKLLHGADKKAQAAAGKEVRRLIDLHGMTPDEVIEGVANGSLASQNQTLRAVARTAYNNASDTARREALKNTGAAAQEGRTKVVSKLMEQTPFEDVSAPGVRNATAVPDVDAQYAAAYGAGNRKIAEEGINPAVRQQIEKIATMHPGVVNLINRNAKAAWIGANRDPAAFKDIVEMKDGAFTWLRDPSMEELANINSSVRDAVSGMYTTQGAVPRVERNTLDNLQRQFRDDLGTEFPEWGSVQGKVARSKASTDGYEIGQRGVGSNNAANEMLEVVRNLNLDDPKDAAKLEGIKAAVIEKVRQMMANSGKTADPMGRGLIGDAESGIEPYMAATLRELFPDEDLMSLLRRGAGDQAQFNALTTGSQTAELQALGNKGGGGIMPWIRSVIASFSDGGMTMMGEGSQMLSKKLNIDEPTADALLQVLTTTDPEILKKIMAGGPEAEGLARQILARLTPSAADVGTTGGGMMGVQGSQTVLPMFYDE